MYHQYYNFSLRLVARYMSVVIIAAVLQCPAFLLSCTKAAVAPPAAESAQIYIQWTKNPTIEAVDLFFFDTTGAKNLDAYQQILEKQAPVYGVSGAGAKILVALSAKAGESAQWYQICTFGQLCKHTFSMMEDSPERPLLSACMLLDDAASRRVNLVLKPMLSQIRIRSVSCDFSGRPYSGLSFHNSKLYLSYAGTECRPLEAGDRQPVSWINSGALDSIAVMSFPRPQLFMREGLGNIGSARKNADAEFACYPHPDTRLVLEGDIGGTRCFYPIPLKMLAPGKIISMDITLRRFGVHDPDIPVESDAVSLDIVTAPWDEREAQYVNF